MDHVCLVLPLLSGQSDSSAEFLRELDAARLEPYRMSQERIGIRKEVWFLGALPGGQSALIAYIEADEFASAVGRFAASTDAFDLWFKRSLAECTGVDLNHPPPLSLPQMLSHFPKLPA